ncbi:OLC1v1033093C2 [Oldenlandia corymbosa var. corymbosa]|uniref:OLC1v1033093C2 n=1 Tax=Oldenlandia corymbosa var. corymbosa TaxID=529605 RepID=A0AAV1CQR7_OLDCO|nr:OLC1v1033093C2 [Oldenlandia corymbosa var. corymbosa]
MNTIHHSSQANPIHHLIPQPLKHHRAASSTGRIYFSLISKRSQKTPKKLVKVSTAEGKWHGSWEVDYNLSLRDLHLQDLAEDGHQHHNSEVSVTLSIDKHAGFGLSVEGRVTTSFSRKCSNCSSPYCREINTNFTVWILPSNKKKGLADDEEELPILGGDDDPSVIYVKPGDEADLDSLIQDSIRLATSVKETCSEACESNEPRLQYLGAQNIASVDKRWSRLLELKNGYLQ